MNPFRGTLNVITYDSAEAVTIDGISWDIYVRNSDLVKDLESNTHLRIQTSEIRYGRWSKKDGLRRGPQLDSSDFRKMEISGNVVFEYLKQHAHDIPFPYNDNYELWLLDKKNNPLALLNSVIYEQDIELQARTTWTSGNAYKISFENKQYNHTTKVNPAEQLNQLILEQAKLYDNNYSAQWIYRNNNETGTGLKGINLESKYFNRKFESQCFPKLLINESIFNNDAQKHISDYMNWLAPWLLVLEVLSNKQRKYFEFQAKQNVLIIAKQFLLYPKIIDQKLVKSARIAAMMSSQQNPIKEQEVMSIDYIELNDPTKIG